MPIEPDVIEEEEAAEVKAARGRPRARVTITIRDENDPLWNITFGARSSITCKRRNRFLTDSVICPANLRHTPRHIGTSSAS